MYMYYTCNNHFGSYRSNLHPEFFLCRMVNRIVHFSVFLYFKYYLSFPEDWSDLEIWRQYYFVHSLPQISDAKTEDLKIAWLKSEDWNTCFYVLGDPSRRRQNTTTTCIYCVSKYFTFIAVYYKNQWPDTLSTYEPYIPLDFKDLCLLLTLNN